MELELREARLPNIVAFRAMGSVPFHSHPGPPRRRYSGGFE
jgi:hypothetical protein